MITSRLGLGTLVLSGAMVTSCGTDFTEQAGLESRLTIDHRNEALAPLDNANMANVKNYLVVREFRTHQGLESGLVMVNSLLGEYDGFQSRFEMHDVFQRSFDEVINFEVGEKEYLRRVVHALWLEGRGETAWSLSDFTREQINSLFFVSDLYQNNIYSPVREPLFPEVLGASHFSPHRIGQITQLREESSSDLFLLAQQFTASSLFESMASVLMWEKKNFFHAYGDFEVSYGWERYADGREDRGVIFEPQSLDRLFEERIVGCYTAAALYTDMLRSINIPALTVTAGHTFAYLPLTNEFVHGDHLSDYVAVPAQTFFLTPQEANVLVAEKEEGDNYSSYFPALYPYNPPEDVDVYTNIGKKRKGDALYIEGHFCTEVPLANVKVMDDEMERYIFTHSYDVENYCPFRSQYMPIRTLDDLRVNGAD